MKIVSNSGTVVEKYCSTCSVTILKYVMITLYQTRVWLFHQRQRQAAEIMTDFVMWHQVSAKWGLPGTLHHLQRRHNYHPQHITILYYLLVTQHGHRMLSFTQFIFTLTWPALLLKPDRKYLCVCLYKAPDVQSVAKSCSMSINNQKMMELKPSWNI